MDESVAFIGREWNKSIFIGIVSLYTLFIVQANQYEKLFFFFQIDSI